MKGSFKKLLALCLIAVFFAVFTNVCLAERKGQRKVRLSLKKLGEQVDPARENSLTLILVEPIDFGLVIPAMGKPSSVVIDAATGRKTAKGGAIILKKLHSRGEYLIRGKPNTRFFITLPDKIKLAAKKEGVLMTKFTTSPAGSGVIGPNGEATLYVGATLLLNHTQQGGLYKGMFNISLDEIVTLKPQVLDKARRR